MSQRDSGYERKERDAYETPGWVTRALVPHIPGRIRNILEPAAGSGKMVDELLKASYGVFASDIEKGSDFLEFRTLWEAVITNPPYALASEFIWQALSITREKNGFVAMLLRTDFDHAASRLHLFQRGQFAKKVVLMKRIKWFDDSKGSPSFNHAWFCWDWTHQGPPTLAYGP